MAKVERTALPASGAARPRNIWSIMGRMEAPKGVERMSLGRLRMSSGMPPPFKKPSTSLVKELPVCGQQGISSVRGRGPKWATDS